jgi:hypothetical protein
MEEANKGINTFVFSVGGDINQGESFGTTSIIICGKETLRPEIDNSHNIAVMKDGLNLEKTKDIL